MEDVGWANLGATAPMRAANPPPGLGVTFPGLFP
jgi:hypothetical protein